MKVFLSWSGDESRAVAQALLDWLPNVMNAVEPWMSAENIEKGSRWAHDLAKALEGTKVGVMCLTPDNLLSPWILFEAGALSKTVENTLVCPYLFRLDHSDVRGPLSQFQGTKAEKEDTKKLVQTINGALGKQSRPEGQLDKAFEVFWPELEKSLGKIPQPARQEAKPARPEREILEEVLELVRAIARTGVPMVWLNEIPPVPERTRYLTIGGQPFTSLNIGAPTRPNATDVLAKAPSIEIAAQDETDRQQTTQQPPAPEWKS